MAFYYVTSDRKCSRDSAWILGAIVSKICSICFSLKRERGGVVPLFCENIELTPVDVRRQAGKTSAEHEPQSHLDADLHRLPVSALGVRDALGVVLGVVDHRVLVAGLLLQREDDAADVHVPGEPRTACVVIMGGGWGVCGTELTLVSVLRSASEQKAPQERSKAICRG